MIDAVIEAAEGAGCYKVILDCSDDNAAFYSKCGLVKKEIQMVSSGRESWLLGGWLKPSFQTLVPFSPCRRSSISEN